LRLSGSSDSETARPSARVDSNIVSPMHQTSLPPKNIRDVFYYSSFISVRGSVDARAGRNMSIKNSNDAIGNRTRKLPACSAVPQATAPLEAQRSLSEKLSFYRYGIEKLKTEKRG